MLGATKIAQQSLSERFLVFPIETILRACLSSTKALNSKCDEKSSQCLFLFRVTILPKIR